MAEILPFDLPFEEAIAYFGRKGFALSPESWREVWQEANARAFTVARVTSMDVLRDIKGALQEAADKGVSLGELKKGLVPMLQAKGWLAPEGEKAKVELPDGTVRKRLTARRLDLIYRANLQSAYSVGRYKQMMEVSEDRPFWQYRAILDSKTRFAHGAMNGKVYDHRHPVWNTWFPQNGWNCRCYVKSLSKDQVGARGLEIEIQGPSVEPDEGWRYNVGEAGLSAWQPDWSKYPKELLGKSPYPIKIEKIGELSVEWRTEVDRALAAIPEAIHKKIGSDYTLKLGEYLTEIIPELKGKHPAGWPEGTTWENAWGVFLEDRKLIGLSELGVDPQSGNVLDTVDRIAGVLAHEFGQVLASVEKISVIETFLDAYEADARSIKPEHREILKYFFGETGARETFAEAFSQALGEPGAAWLDMDKAFPKVMKYVRSYVKGIR